MAGVRLLPSIILLLLLLFLFSPVIFSTPDSEALIKLNKSFKNTKSLDSWKLDSNPCTGETQWVGVVCFNGIITGLRLGQMGLSGKIDIDALLEIPGLRTVSFVNNSFSGPIPEFNRMGTLKAIYLSGNHFSGEIPASYFSKMESLKKVWLSGNRFTGEIPSSLTKLPHLMELHLEGNQFSGSIPPISQTTLLSLDLSKNNLEGEIPESLSKFDATSFAGNAGLCGKQLGKVCNPSAAPPAPAPPTPPPSSSSSMVAEKEPQQHKVTGAAITLTLVILLMLVGVIIVMRRRDEEFKVLGRKNLDDSVEVHVPTSSRNQIESSRKTELNRRGSNTRKGAAAGMAELVVVNDEKGVFGLPDLMKAAAEVLGTGGLGSAYKAVMSNGVAVVVKRMKEMNRLGKDGFDSEVKRLGKLRHKNILTPLAYHYRKEEKLLIYEFIPKGSLLYLLHGDRGPCHAELNWPARLKIIQGIARGIGYLHAELASSDIPHGNLKSSNVLLGSNYEPLLADYGFYTLVNPPQAAQAMFAYKSPEAVRYHQVSPKCDVYSLGIIILEVLTGKFPSQYLNNGNGGTDVVQWVLSAIQEKKEAELLDPEISAGSKDSLGDMARLLHIGADCTENSPERRPDMREAIKRILEIQVEGGQETRTVHMAPSLRDGYADAPSVNYSHASSVREGYGDLSVRRPESFQDRSGRRNGDSFAFAIS